ncbi:alpha-L-fucosidase [Nonomuraea typhae]|uniref:alpha-L-fucosidase n=1 Tax=Nonomuraea typhae TaxID=2603600 RepID=UPI0012F9E917|nr:alpha-L-fucosidase [Nonomuraea typhae]
MRSRALVLVLILLSGLLWAPPARAEVEHPRQQWLRASTAGLFLHWGMFTAPRHLDCAAWERDVTEGGWSADYWVDEARKLGASYIVLATFHSRLGYARPWPSAIPGSCSTKRDLLGELVAAGKAKDVRIILYMTDDPQWHSEQGVQTLDSAAYSAYKGRPVDLTTRDGFGMYSYDLFFEVMENYADLAGFWIDNDNAYWERNNLYEQIRERRPGWLLSNNNEDTPIMDTVSNEQKTGMIPSYDYPQAAWTPMPRLVEADYKLPSTGQWWYDGGDHAVDTRLSTGRYITNAGSSMKSLMAETPMVNGRFPPKQEAFNAFMSRWVPPIRSSLYGTEGGGYVYGGMQPGFWNDGAHGVITVEPGARTQYVHVVTRPSTDRVRLRDNGYWVTRVTDVRTGRSLAFHQSAGYLTILGITDWDPYDTVFKVETRGRHFYHDKITASSPELVDGNFSTYWDNQGRLPADVTLDLGHRRVLTSLAINQREWSPTYARESFGRPEDSARIKDYRVYLSDDGRNWGSPIREGALRSARGVQFIDLGERRARHVKLEVLDTWGGPQAPRYHRRLQIDEIKVAYAHPFSLGPAAPLEAEHANRSRGARPEPCRTCSGNLQVTGPGTLAFTNVTAPEDGTYRLQIDHTAARATSVKVTVNDAPAAEVPIRAGNRDVPVPTALAVPLKKGTNTVTLEVARAGIDRIAVSPLPPDGYVPATTLTVEPGGLQWTGPGQQSLKVSATLRLDVDDQLDQVTLAPQLPPGWTVQGGPATAASLRLGQTLGATWTLTSPPGQDVGAADIPVTAAFQVLGRSAQAAKQLRVRLRPADRVWMREAEDSANRLGDAGITGCGACSGGQKVRNLGGGPGAYVEFGNVTVPSAGTYTLVVDYTVNGPRSFFVTVNGGAPVEVKVDGVGNNTPYTTTVPITLGAGPNTVKIHNDTGSAPDLDRLSLS